MIPLPLISINQGVLERLIEEAVEKAVEKLVVPLLSKVSKPATDLYAFPMHPSYGSPAEQQTSMPPPLPSMCRRRMRRWR